MGQTTILTIELPLHLEDYCRHEMRTDKQGRIILRRTHDIGRVIYAQILTYDTPIKRMPYTHPVEFIVPVTGANRYALVSRFLYVSRWGEEKIKDYIECEFNQRMRSIFEAGYLKRYTQKEIIESIILTYNIRNTAINYEAIKKADYRHQRKVRKMIFDDIECSVL